MKHALFEGLVIDENDRPVSVVLIGSEPCYVVDDAGFRRHIPSEDVDRQVLKAISESIQGHEDALGEQTAKMLGAEDPFSVAIIENQLRNLDKQFDQVLELGIPEESRTYLGMVGFRVRINLHGEVIEIEQPGMIADDDQ